MLTALRVRNFKVFDSIHIDLGRAVVFIGPNNSGKTSALQALALWNTGVKRWSEKRPKGKKRTGVAINRKDLLSIPIPAANLMWRDRRVRNVQRAEGKQTTTNIRIEIVVDGITEGVSWSCGMEFDYANEEAFYCRPLRQSDEKGGDVMPIPAEAVGIKVAFLPPMSGLGATEYLKHQGEIDVLIGQGQTAEVLRNLCYKIYLKSKDSTEWQDLCNQLERIFGVRLSAPELIPERSEIVLLYEDRRGNTLDISCAGRGLLQTLLLLAHIYANPKTVLLIDEPDAHLEVLRQRQTYQLINDVAQEHQSQVICASHSEVVLNEAADRDTVVAFVGKPHRIDTQSSQVRKALVQIGWEDYFQAEQTGWVLYLEGSTDLAILQKLAQVTGHSVREFLERPFVHYVGNEAQRARDHFYGLREACPQLTGIALFDNLSRELAKEHLVETMWRRREIENYLCSPEVLVEYARGRPSDDLFLQAEEEQREKAMKECIAEVTEALRVLGRPGPWSSEIKVTNDFLDPLFEKYFEKLGLSHLMPKKSYHELADFLDASQVDEEIIEKFDKILEVASSGRKEN